MKRKSLTKKTALPKPKNSTTEPLFETQNQPLVFFYWPAVNLDRK